MLRFRQFAAPAILGAALFVGGCAHERHEDIPLTAMELDEGKETVVFNAVDDGRVYVYDATSDDMLYNGELRRGQQLRVDAKENKILVDNQTAVERDLVNDHRFKIFFDRDESAATASQTIPPPQSANTTIVTPPGARTSVTTDPNPAAAPAQPRTTITTDPNHGRTTVTTPDTKVTTDPETGRTTVQPR